jgi:transposase
MHCIGELRTAQLDIAPAQLRVRVTRRPRYACRTCESAVVVAPAPERPIDGGMPIEALIVHVVVSKFCDSLPLYRQSQMLARPGVVLDRSTLGNWVGSACWRLTPLYELVVATALSSPKIFADDTSLPVLDPGRGRTKTGYLWCYAVDDRPWRGATHPAVAEDRKNARPAEHLARFEGVLQVDGYGGFKRLAGERTDGSIQWLGSPTSLSASSRGEPRCPNFTRCCRGTGRHAARRPAKRLGRQSPHDDRQSFDNDGAAGTTHRSLAVTRPHDTRTSCVTAETERSNCDPDRLHDHTSPLSGRRAFASSISELPPRTRHMSRAPICASTHA